ncbi:NAD(P)-binding protein [Dendrothele bispora CBS 962.96]|uniref:NAD(P)-binding protein n=1 Tax=Dendrothele bispora (strain CBS 962.96) TaxID=1314807 RepID=A0A4V4HC53_DENBC|nr:NAD(P)-binding protein [Dendrothele bispora CBS 962.96]
MPRKVILVSGATGRQGEALIASLSTVTPFSSSSTSDSEPQEPFHILALTRNTSSSAATFLSRKQNVSVVVGNLDDVQSIRSIFEEYKTNGLGGIWGVFCVLKFPGLGANADGEEKQGKNLADLALEYDVQSFVFSSVERGSERDDDKAVLDRLAKVRIEHHIKSLGEKGLPWTILRPSFFMENYEGTIGSITVGVLKTGLKPTTTIQMIAVDDIGRVAAGVFKDPDQFKHEILPLAGERSTISSQETAYRKATGHSLPSIPKFLARALISLNSHTKDLLADIERVHLITSNSEDSERWHHQVSFSRKAYPEPGMMSFETWAKQKYGRSLENELGTRGTEPGSSNPGRWNQISIWKLVTGRL